jgi:hypothetical protein
LQNIQLSKSVISWGPSPQAPEAYSGTFAPELAHSRGPDAPLRSLARKTVLATLKSRNCLRRRPVGCATNIAALTAGLKPATTKQRSRRRLQRTRRSCYAPKLFCQRTEDSSRRRESAVGRNRLKLFCPPSRFSLRRTAFISLPAEAAQRRRLVENTGLEPVTSWLQTRRSPS